MMRSAIRMLSAALLVSGVVPALAGAQSLVGRSDTIYTWRGTVPSGGLFTVKNFNGPVDVRAASGSTIELRAEKRVRGGSYSDIGFDVDKSSNGDVMICAVQSDDDSCDGNNHRRDRDDGRWRRELSVTMTVLVPRGVRVRVATGNGALTVDGAGSDVEASSGNGRVRVSNTSGTVRVSTGNGEVEVRDAKGRVHVSTGNGDVDVTTSEGPVEVSSGNGDIDVRMSALRAREDMEFHTGSGSVRLTLPSNYSGELDASTGNGTINSDFDLKVKGQLNPRHVRATIGDGGAMLRMSTGNGRFDIRKG